MANIGRFTFSIRTGVPEDCLHLLIDQYDALLKSEHFKQSIIPDVVIRFGAQPVSKPLSLYLKEVQPEIYIAVDEDPIVQGLVRGCDAPCSFRAQVFWKELSNIQENEALINWTEANKIATTHVEQYIQEQHDEGALLECYSIICLMGVISFQVAVCQFGMSILSSIKQVKTFRFMLIEEQMELMV